jgi:hypothetical protein
MQTDQVPLLNAFGLDNVIGSGFEPTGAASNEMTAAAHCEWFACTPWGTLIAANIEALG